MTGGGGRGSGGGRVGGEGVGQPYPEYSRGQLVVALLMFPLALLLTAFVILVLDITFNAS